MIPESHQKMYLWQSEQARMMVLQHILAALCEVFSITYIMMNELVEEFPLHDIHVCQI
jgi:hypothetical protein